MIWSAVTVLLKEIEVKRGYAHDTPRALSLVAHHLWRKVGVLNKYDLHFESADGMRNNVFLNGKPWR